MEVVNPRSALLSNYEVLKLLKELEAEQLVLARAALVKKEGDDNEPKNTTAALGEIVSENMRTVQFEAIEHLSTDPLSTSKQDDKNVARLLQQLQSYALTKVEKLQIVNLLPTRQVELYVIIEDVEDRFTSEQMEAMTEMIKTCMNNPDPDTSDIPLDDLQTYQNDADADGDIVIGEDQWQDQDDPEEFVDGPRYGEYEDDLGGDGMDDDDE